MIGVVCEGINLGRYGKLCWLVVSTSHAYVLALKIEFAILAANANGA